MNDLKTTFDVSFTVNDVSVTKVEVTVDPNREYIQTVVFQTTKNETWTFPTFFTDREYLLDLTKEYLEYGYEVLMEWFHTLLDVYPSGYVSNSGWSYDPTTQHIKTKITKFPATVKVGNGITVGGFAIDYKGSDLRLNPTIRPVDVRNHLVIEDSTKWEVPVRHISIGVDNTEAVQGLYDGDMQVCKNVCKTMLQLYPHGIGDPKPTEKELTIIKEFGESTRRCIDELVKPPVFSVKLLEIIEDLEEIRKEEQEKMNDEVKTVRRDFMHHLMEILLDHLGEGLGRPARWGDPEAKELKAKLHKLMSMHNDVLGEFKILLETQHFNTLSEAKNSVHVIRNLLKKRLAGKESDDFLK